MKAGSLARDFVQQVCKRLPLTVQTQKPGLCAHIEKHRTALITGSDIGYLPEYVFELFIIQKKKKKVSFTEAVVKLGHLAEAASLVVN